MVALADDSGTCPQSLQFRSGRFDSGFLRVVLDCLVVQVALPLVLTHSTVCQKIKIERTVIRLSEYTLEMLRNDGELVVYSGHHRPHNRRRDLPSILVMTPVSRNGRTGSSG